MKNTILNKFPKQPYTIYNVVSCFFAWFTFVGTANWYQGIDEPTLWQRVYKWRISPKTGGDFETLTFRIALKQIKITALGFNG